MQFMEQKQALQSTDPNTRKAAALEIGALAKDKKVDETCFLPLEKLLDDKNSEVQKAASTALFWLSIRGVVENTALPKIIENLESKDPMIRHDMASVIEAYANKGIFDQTCIPLIVANLDHENPHTRAATIYCVGTLIKQNFIGQEYIDRIDKFSDDKDKGVRDAVEHALKLQ